MRVMLDEGAFMPERQHPLDAGLDLRIPDNGKYKNCRIYPQSSVFIDTGVHVELPQGHVGLVMTRSGMNKQDLHCEGVIDENYRGSIGVTLYNGSTDVYEIEPGHRIAQLVIVKCWNGRCELAGFLSDSDRGENGFGSTGV